MKKRIIAALVLITVIFSTCTIASAKWTAVEGGASVVVDFNGDDYDLGYAGHNKQATYPETDGIDGTRCLFVDGAWAVSPTTKKIFTTEAGKSYKFSCQFKGALYCLYLEPISVKASDTDFTDMIVRNGGVAVSDWTESSFVFTTAEAKSLNIMLQSGESSLYIDNIKIEEVEEGTVPAPEATSIAYPESPHDYPNNYDRTWTIYEPGAKGIAITFSYNTYVEAYCDYIYIYDQYDSLLGTYTGWNLEGKRLCISGNEVKIRLTSNYSGRFYGFAITNVQSFYYWSSMPYWWEPLGSMAAATTEAPVAATTEAPVAATEPPWWYPELTATPAATVATPIVTLAPTAAERSPRPSRSPSPTPTVTPTPTSSPTSAIKVSEDYEYKIKDDFTVQITAYKGSKNIVNIPDKIDGLTVTSIGDSAFKNNNVIQSVILPDTIKTIGASAFESCELLNNIGLNENLKTIGERAFFNCRALSIAIIPQSVTSIGDYAFGHDSSFSPILGFTISGFDDSEAQVYAEVYELNYNSLGGSGATAKKSIKFIKKSVKIKKGKKVTLKVKITGAKKATFTTNKKKVAKIVKKSAKKVVVKGMRKGKATITAKVAGKKAKCKVTVV